MNAPQAGDSAPVGIRRALRSEAEALASFASRLFVETFGEANTPEDMRAYVNSSFGADRIADELDDPRSLTLVADQDGAFIAYARLSESGPASADTTPNGMELLRMYVDSAHHGKGLAAQLMTRCIAEARARGHRRMYLGVWEHIGRAQAFYAKWGFTRSGQHEFWLGDDRQTDWIMERSI